MGGGLQMMEDTYRDWKPAEPVLRRYLERLLEASRRVNLTAVRDPAEAWERHILDSLTLMSHIGDAHNILDVGAGGGLPGLVLAIACPDLDISLLEATGKKCRFLEEVCDELELANVEIINERAETAARLAEYRECFDLVTARAFAPLPVLLECTVPFARVGGRILAMKGGRARRELDEAAGAIQTLSVSLVDMHEVSPATEAVVMEFRKDGATGPDYPRRPGKPAKRPIR